MSYYRLYNKDNEIVRESELFEDISVYLDDKWQELCADRRIDHCDMNNFDTLVYMILSGYRLEEED